MYKLYGKQADTWKIIDLSVDKKDIVNDMIDISNRHNFYNYKINDTQNESETIISNPTELKIYLDKYKKRIKPLEDMSCVELKRYILDKKSSR